MDRTYNALFFGEVDVEHANEILRENGYEGLVLVDNGFSKLVTLDLNVEHLRIYNLIPKGVDKSSAIKLDKKVRKLKTESCIALGDSAEDLKMAKEVHAFFLMSDAAERNKEILDLIKNYNNVYMTDQGMNRGWVEVVKYLAQ
jgi:hydroxymethylpyrimidine pyrophosphatase-like HAD family hydrolase